MFSGLAVNARPSTSDCCVFRHSMFDSRFIRAAATLTPFNHRSFDILQNHACSRSRDLGRDSCQPVLPAAHAAIAHYETPVLPGTDCAHSSNVFPLRRVVFTFRLANLSVCEIIEPHDSLRAERRGAASGKSPDTRVTFRRWA